MIIEIFSELRKKYGKIAEITMFCDGYVEVYIKSLLDEMLAQIKEFDVLQRVLTNVRRESIKNRIDIIIEFDEKICQDISVCVKKKCRKAQQEILCDMPNSGGVVIYEVCDRPEYIVVDWMGKGYFVTCIGSDEFIIIADGVSDELLGMIKYFVTAPFVLSEEIHLIHGTSISFNDKNYLIMADSGKGKTSLAILFCINGGFLISEDISYMSKSAKIINLCSRNYFTLRKGTLYAFKDFFCDLYREENLSQKELYMLGKESQQRVSIDLFQLQQETRSDLEKIDCVIVPEINSELDGYSITILNDKEIENIYCISSRDFMVSWIKILLSFDFKGGIERSCEMKKIKFIKLCTGFNYRSNFKKIVNEL